MQVATLEQLQKVVDYSSFLESHISRLEPKGFRVRASVFWLWWWWKGGGDGRGFGQARIGEYVTKACKNSVTWPVMHIATACQQGHAQLQTNWERS